MKVYFFQGLETSNSKMKLTGVKIENHEEFSTNNSSWDTKVARVNDDYMTQVQEEKEGRVTRNLSQECNRTKSRYLGALSKVNNFF